MATVGSDEVMVGMTPVFLLVNARHPVRTPTSLVMSPIFKATVGSVTVTTNVCFTP